MDYTAKAIKKLMKELPRVVSKEEASKALRAYGIIDANNNITPEYKLIVVHSDTTK